MPLRSISIQANFLRTAPSCLVEFGGTRVLCTATVTEQVPPFLRNTGRGWLTAEYAMLPASTNTRKPREGIHRDGRGVEISRLIGRSLRQALDLSLLGERTVTVDCDVLEADGGTRTASITGGYVALALAIDQLMRSQVLSASPLVRQIAAVSVGIIGGTPALDLCYEQDAKAQVDMNVVMDESGSFIELQGTGESAPFSRQSLNELLDLAAQGIEELLIRQRAALGEAAKWLPRRLPRLLLASNNPHKLQEFQALLKDFYAVVSPQSLGLALDVEETGQTFTENAILKAEAFAKHTGLPTIADDSGLLVDALAGAPGVHSARYAGKHGDDQANNRLLLENLERLGGERTAHFVCVIALARPGQKTKTFEGRVSGVILREPRGASGFGYDPIFQYENGETFAEMPPEMKNQVSHRKRGADALVKALRVEATC